jgi:putative DNA primase/helicase
MNLALTPTTTAARPGAALDAINTENNPNKHTLFQHFPERCDLESECLVHMKSNGILFSGPLKMNCGIQRFSIDKKKNQPDEWYVAQLWEYKNLLYLICHYGSWSAQSKHTYKSWGNNSFDLPNEEREALNRYLENLEQIAKAEESKRHNEVAKEANETWNAASEIPLSKGHSAYLDLKRIQPYGIRFGKNPNGYDSIIVPLKNLDGFIRSLQFISVGSSQRIYKTFLSGGEKKGCFFVIGDLTANDVFYIAEGYSTASSVHEVTSKPVVVAFDCGNLDAVISGLREKYPNHKTIIAGDDDVETEQNPGKTKALEAVRKYGCGTVFPKFDEKFKLPNGKRPTDWNDLHYHFGVNEAHKQLSSFQERKPRLVTLSHNELIGKTIPARKFVLKPWLPEAGVSMIYAPTGVGKTYLCLSIAKAIASGGRLFTWEASERRRVLYVDAEMHESDLQARVKKLLSESVIDDDYLRYWNGSWQADLFLPDLSTSEGQKFIEEIIDHYGIQVLFLDNLSTLCRTGKENETTSWMQMQNWLLKLRWKGVATVLVHHAGKAKDGSGKPVQRGTSMREVVLESSLVLCHPKDYTEEQGCVFEVKYAKARGFWGADSEPFEAKLIEKNGVSLWEHRSLVLKTYDLVVDLYNQGITNPKAIGEEVGVSRQAVNKHIERAKNDGEIS